KTEEAAEDFRRAIALNPGRYQAHLSLAMVYQNQRKWAEALAEIDTALRSEPSWAVLRRRRARINQDRGALEAALRDFEEAARAKARGAAPDRAGDHYDCGRLLHLLKRYAEAVAACDA